MSNTSKRCVLCQKSTAGASYYRGRYICEECLHLIKDTF